MSKNRGAGPQKQVNTPGEPGRSGPQQPAGIPGGQQGSGPQQPVSVPGGQEGAGPQRPVGAPSEQPASRPPQAVGAPEPREAPIGEPLDLQVYLQVDIGRSRTHNEDYVGYFIPPDQRQLARKGALYLAADGMGGHNAGEVASQGAVELAIGEYFADTQHDVGTSLVRAFRAANKQIYDWAQADAAKSGMGTTLVGAVVHGRKVWVANVGDSRAYLIRNNKITQITEDHSWVEEQVRAGLLTKEQARRHPQRNVVTRALGSKPSVEVDLFEGEIKEGDILVLCTDGLTGHVEDPEIAAIVQQHSPEESARLLIDQANARGGSDNIGVLIVSAHEPVPTEVVPPIVVAEEEPARSFPLIPVMGGVAVLLAVLLVALLVGQALFRPRPTATVATETLAPVGTEVPPVVEPSATGETLVTSPPIETPAQPVESPAQPVETPAQPVESPAQPPQETLGPATATLAAKPPTSTPAPTLRPTLTRPPTPVRTALPSPTPKPSYSPPILAAPRPEDAKSLRGHQLFEWSYPRELEEGEAFQILIWKEGDLHHNGATGALLETKHLLNLDQVPRIQQGRVGEYKWSVVVVVQDDPPGRQLSPEAPAWAFTYAGPASDSGDGDDGGNGGGPGH